MRMIALILGLFLLLVAPCRSHAWTVQKYDCVSPVSYMTGNVGTVVLALKSFLPGFALQAGWVPEAKGWAGLGYTGLGAGLGAFYVQVGGSPQSVINIGLHLMCLSLEP